MFPHMVRSPLLPPPLPHWPGILYATSAAAAEVATVAAAWRRLQEETLWWPVPRARASCPRAVAFAAKGMAQARAHFDDAEIASGSELAAIDPARLEAVFAPPPTVARWAAMGGIRICGVPVPDVEADLRVAQGRCPWSDRTIDLATALEAQALLRAAALRACGPVTFVDLSRWKRRCLEPFFQGPDGSPRRATGTAVEATRPTVRWGTPETRHATFHVEDGFLRSIGLGLQYALPVSLVVASGPLHLDATRRNAFDDLVAAVDFTPALRARAARLRHEIVRLRLTKYNLRGVAALPDPGDRPAILVPGQVEDDASIRLGTFAVTRNQALLEAVRSRFPEAFILFKPHPDVVAGKRPGAVIAADALRFADAVADNAAMPDCLDWATRVATMTSLTGFEALLRGKAATTFGRPFYAGWGLTDDVDPPQRERGLTLDELVAAALILYPSYIDPVTRLPAPVEVAIAALAGRRASAAPRTKLLNTLRYRILPTLAEMPEAAVVRLSRALRPRGAHHNVS